jgi:tetratricopeptide (TPR) repeat protein
MTSVKYAPASLTTTHSRVVERRIKTRLICQDHPLKNTLLIVTLSIGLSACTTLQSHTTPQAAAPAAQPQLAQNQPMVRKTSTSPAESRIEDPLPEVELTEDLLYKLLAAEIAYQQGDWQTGYVTTLSVAQQTRDPRLARRAAEMALAAKQADEALSAVRLWHSLAPHSEEAIQYYLSFLVLGDKLDEAKPVLQQRLAEARPPTRSVLIFQIQRLLSRAKDKDAAFAVLEELLAPYLNLPESHIALAQSAFAHGDNERAQNEAHIALKAKPDSELAALTLAQVMQDKTEAARSLDDFVHRYPDAHNVRIAYARMLVEKKQYAKARSEFETLLKEQPQDLTSLYALGVLSLQTNDLQAAENYLTTYLKVLAANPDETRDSTQALLLLAQIAEDRKDSDAELKWLGQVEPGEAYLGAQTRRAQIIAKEGDIEGARRLLHELNATGELEQAQIVIAEGQILRDANRLPEAMSVFQAGLKSFPDNTDLLYDYAMTAEKSDQLDVMEKALRKVIELAPNNQQAYNALGYSLAERNMRLQEAYSLIDKALTLAPEDPFIIDSMGWVQFRMGKFKEAETLLRRAYSLRPDAEIAVHLGEVLWIKGEKDDAQKFWRDAQTKDPQNDTLKSTLARLNVRL